MKEKKKTLSIRKKKEKSHSVTSSNQAIYSSVHEMKRKEQTGKIQTYIIALVTINHNRLFKVFLSELN